MTSATQTFGSSLTISRQKALVGNVSLTISTLVIVAIVVAASIFHVWSRMAVLRMGEDISEHAQNIKKLSAEGDRLKAEVATLKSPERIEKIARENLGMVFPKPEQVIIIGTEKPANAGQTETE